MKMTCNLLAVVVLVSVVSTSDQTDQCYWNSSSLYKYFGGKTLYDDVRGDIRNVTKLNGCEPISIWLLSRHGSRNPGAINIKQIKEVIKLKDDIVRNHAQGRGTLCNKDVANLQAWRWNDTIDSTPYFLTSRGYKELKGLGARINETYYNLLKDLHVNYIRATNEQRTVESAKSFVSGLDAKLGFTLQEPLKEQEDFVLLPYKNCERHLQEFHNVSWKNAVNKYHETEDYKQLLRDVQKRAGLSEPLTDVNMTGLFDMCRFYRSYSEDGRAPWCALFLDQDLEVLEYEQDLVHYFRSGYGLPINIRLGELVLNDLLNKFQATVYHHHPSFTAYFSHDSLIDMVYCALGLYHDEELPVETRTPKRRWRTSLNTPFAANVIAVLYNCTELVDGSPHKVHFFANEKILRVCEEACSWKAFEEKFRPFVKDFSSLSVCKINTT